jgi:hypothetical protein
MTKMKGKFAPISYSLKFLTFFFFFPPNRPTFKDILDEFTKEGNLRSWSSSSKTTRDEFVKSLSGMVSSPDRNMELYAHSPNDVPESAPTSRSNSLNNNRRSVVSQYASLNDESN